VESVGPATFDQSVRSTAAGGRIAVCGSTSGQKIELTVPVLFFKQLEIIGSTMFTHEEFRQVTALVDSHKVHPQVDNAFAFEELPAALARLDSGDQLGKVALRF
jgi:zinc-binding alcohol dehydrogenase/oxidoreductase